MLIKETFVFTRQIVELMPDDEYRLLQSALLINPALGDIIQSSCGIRKVRWKLPGKGKRGGARIIYYWQVNDDFLFMLLAYSKSHQEDLTPKELKILKSLVEEAFKDGKKTVR